MTDSFYASLARHRDVFARLEALAPELHEWFALCRGTLESGGKLLWMGNGGSAADSQHLAAEFMVRYKQERGPLRALALTTDTSILTAHSNDYSFDTVFARQVEALADSRDLVIGLSTSGNSRNVNLALEAANRVGATSVVLTGRDGGEAKRIAKLSIVVPSDETARIQEAHIFLGHWLCEAFDTLYSAEV
jgi:D-sedoheptulose 7-phosphate isomerase